MNYNLISLILLTGAAGVNIQNEYVQYGFLGLLLSLLFWYSRSSYKGGLRRELKGEEEKEKLIERYEKKLEEEAKRYHEIHMEIMALLKMDKHK
jgi:hypothetical protein